MTSSVIQLEAENDIEWRRQHAPPGIPLRVHFAESIPSDNRAYAAMMVPAPAMILPAELGWQPVAAQFALEFADVVSENGKSAL